MNRRVGDVGNRGTIGGVKALLLRARTDFGEGDDVANAFNSFNLLHEEPFGGAFEYSLFGLLLPLDRESWALLGEGFLYCFIKLAMEWWQLFPVFVRPFIGWNIDKTERWWLVLSWWDLSQSYSKKSYESYLTNFYVVSAVLVTICSLAGYLGYLGKRPNYQQHYKRRWPARFLFFALAKFVDIFGVTLLRLAEVGLECNYLGFHGTASNGLLHTLHLQAFPDRVCRASPTTLDNSSGVIVHSVLGHVVAAWLMLIITIILGVAYSLRFSLSIGVPPAAAMLGYTCAGTSLFGAPDCRNQRWLATANSFFEPSVWICKAVATLGPVIFGWRRIQGLFILSTSTYMTLSLMRYVPHVSIFMSAVRAGSFASLLYAAGVGTLISFKTIKNNKDARTFNEPLPYVDTPSHDLKTLWVGMLVFGFMAMALLYVRVHGWYWYVKYRFSHAHITINKAAEAAEESFRRAVEIRQTTAAEIVGMDPTQAASTVAAVVVSGNTLLSKDPAANNAALGASLSPAAARLSFNFRAPEDVELALRCCLLSYNPKYDREASTDVLRAAQST
eukprot:CAMPEP_0175038724 /NCGR_PEP_ID=MMETSP0052_2-20121109/39_1 /TAXON_ID=51329 ORGANISM="Polytomella parva, Strain SAG 63-3" /NCGR_SAMPLE_ID=MMETSP0052_2 /ASSEMBLY_ACC=CAM_ASM_000194 /LENGTH=558 /DNA_ID=CAMNT_0016300201 /DNA_START=33 /DNA_END=1706 /DNA_ORIENTATION=-